MVSVEFTSNYESAIIAQYKVDGKDRGDVGSVVHLFVEYRFLLLRKILRKIHSKFLFGVTT